MSMLTQPSQTAGATDRFRALCAELEDYETLPELTPSGPRTRLITEQSHEDTLAESILAGLTHP